jgi:imidazole glycerol phosphate synthase subunit HisF
MSLVPQTVNAVNIPVGAAGSIADARGMKAAFAPGAEGVQMATTIPATEKSEPLNFIAQRFLPATLVKQGLLEDSQVSSHAGSGIDCSPH